MIDIVLIGVIFLFINFGIGGFFMFYSDSLLSRHLIKKHRQRWESHRLIPGYPNTPNLFKTVPYVFNKQDTGDKVVLKIKKRFRFWIFYTFLSFILVVPWVILSPLIERLIT